MIVSVMVPPTIMVIRDAQIRRAGVTMASRARWLASERLEDVIADRHSTTRGYPYAVNGNYPAEAAIAGFAGFSRSVVIVQTGPDLVTPGAGYKVITVTVSWMDPFRGTVSLPLSSVVTDY